MIKLNIRVAAAMLAASASAVSAQDATEAIKAGAVVYRQCAACHLLQPDVHLSGPSLAGLWGKRAGTVAGFGRYTEALKQSEILWDASALYAWTANPGTMIPGTSMNFRGIHNDKTRENLVAFLEVALAPDGGAKAIKDDLISASTAQGQLPPDLSSTEPSRRVTEIRHCGDAYHVVTADGAAVPYWETNVRLKIDTSPRGPKTEEPVLHPSGMVGDRVSIIFSSLANLQRSIAEGCK